MSSAGQWLSGATALIGARQSVFNGFGNGGAYVFERDGTTWEQKAKLVAGDGAIGDEFGSAVALDGGIALIGAHFEDSVSGFDAGSAYVFVRNGFSWFQEAKLTSGPDSSENDEFGAFVALDGNTAVIGSIGEDIVGQESGSAYVFLVDKLPEITQQPISQTVVPGTLVTLSVAATGYAPLRYQWRKDGFGIAGANGLSLTVQVPAQSPFVDSEGGYYVVVSNIGGVVTSAPAVLKVNALSQFTQTLPDAPLSAQGSVLVNLSLVPPSTTTTVKPAWRCGVSRSGGGRRSRSLGSRAEIGGLSFGR